MQAADEDKALKRTVAREFGIGVDVEGLGAAPAEVAGVAWEDAEEIEAE